MLFESMPEKNVVSWNAMISGLSDHSLLGEAKKLFDEMDQRDEASWNSMISSNARSGDFELAEELMRKMPRWSLISQNAMIVSSGKMEGHTFPKRIFDSIHEKDSSQWTAMLSAYAGKGDISETLDFFEKLPEWSIVTWTIMTAALARNGRIEDAKLLFDRAPRDQRDAAAWNVMISALLECDLHEEAFGMVQAMDLDGVRPNKVTLVAALEACCGCSSLSRAKTIHSLLRENDHLGDPAVRTAVTNTFGRLGDSSLIQDHPADTHAWNAILSAHSQRGGFQEAVDAFLAMNLEGIAPDSITFMTTLALCGHTGAPDEGWREFVSMEVDHGVRPETGHYACMVDVLARAGRLAEAEELVMSMPFEPDELALRAILAACKLHVDCKQGVRAVEKIVELDSGDGMPYIMLLSSLCPSTG
ncbi:pentatricopeptide repeat-containing protein At4g16835, mitochondrial-like isoform X1 [Selaginella moellendorffii]|uniref:pentatricopeptide repeat-containing protein At4g16835, mitochondrial-like isoform X1 n=1 Tax=Selaginella moellendorffii TaxID=88036 RepID=UPI000D1C2446|nr:pentatricopeptide repeat-containing protein At4g16835, mitochondrial-like isoform X1 [Selaginella moellendorffii]|eukprot:XP_024529906.1 pentatricopeptide repeat-containing protein At4g16835, mitochondrial-like isoform X1 [Selaginella moellendorffii]